VPRAMLLGVGAGIAVSLIGAALAARSTMRSMPIDALLPAGSYERDPARGRRAPRLLTFAGVVAVGLSAAAGLPLPIGVSPTLADATLLVGFCGALLLLPNVVPWLARAVQRPMSALLGPIGHLAAGALLRTPGRTTVTVGGIATAAAFVLAVNVSIGSYRRATDEAAAAWYGAPLYVSAEGPAGGIPSQPLPGTLARRLVAVPGVKAAYPMRYALIVSRGYQVLIVAIPVARAAAAGDRVTGSLGISQSQLARALGRGEVIISRLAARRHHLAPGDLLRVPTSRGPIGLRIAGLFNDVTSFDSVLIEHSVYERLARDAKADRFAIVTRPGANTGAVKHALERTLDTGGVQATVLDRAQMVGGVVNGIQSLFSIARGIEAVALLMSGLIVLSTMLTATFERRREFGMQRAIGMSRAQLGGSVVLEAIGIAIVGSIVAVCLGLGLGFLLTLSIESELAWRIAFSPSPPTILAVLALVTLIGVAAALYPIWLVTRQGIAESLNFE